VNNLACEGITRKVNLVGDTMYDAVLQLTQIARNRSTILQDLGLNSKGYLLTTVHRAHNTDLPENLINILSALVKIGDPIVFPVHPRTRQRIAELDGMFSFDRPMCNVKLIDPIGYLDMLVLEANARVILTDSGGIQKEAFFLDVPCVTLRSETEWVETVQAGWNVLTGTDPRKIIETVQSKSWPNFRPQQIFGAGDAALRILATLASSC